MKCDEAEEGNPELDEHHEEVQKNILEVEVKKQIAMLLNTKHFNFKGCIGSIYLFTLIAFKKQIAMLF